MKRAVNIITSTLLVLVLLLAAALVGVRLFGIAPYTVLSGSMEPTYPVGSLIYVKPIDTNDLQVGSQHHLLKRLSLIHCIFLPPLSKISCPYVCGLSLGFLFCSIDLYVCLCASTILS